MDKVVEEIPQPGLKSTFFLRRVRDSNPRSRKAGQQISSLPRSTAPATLHYKRENIKSL